MEQQLTFGADCVLRLEDLGQFKDYSDIVEALANELHSIQLGKQTAIPHDLWEVLAADPEDTFHLPSFKSLLNHIININWQTIALSNEHYNKILLFYFCVVEECLLSFTFGEQALQSLIIKLQKLEHSSSSFQKPLLRMLLRLSDKVVFIEQIQQLVKLWEIVDEELLIKTETQNSRDLIAAVYLECVQKYTRSRKFRAALAVKQVGGPCLVAKIAAWRKDKQKLKEQVQILSNRQYYSSNFVKEMMDYLSTKL